ncbi:phospholipase D/nuclease [Xylariaceae sp. FL1272]|nr:phospholipase D/nuclease [Xylariaceae sp. FL1272]
MDADDDDAALRYAIALSLQDASPSATADNPLVIDDEDDEDDDLEKGPSYAPPPKKPSSKLSTREEGKDENDMKRTTDSAPPTHQGSFSVLGLDRKKMEEERLARAAKRKATTGELSGPPARRVKVERESDEMLNRFSSKPEQTQPDSKGLVFPDGAVKKTWAKGYPRQNDIKIEEVFQKDHLQLAVLSSFQWDDEWMLSKIDIKKTKIVCIAYAKDEAHKEQMRANVPRDRIRFCFPPMKPFGNMHSKLQILKFPNHLRVVIPTGNLVPYDWGETGVMENMLFLIDLPRTDEPKLGAERSLFGQDLCFFLRASDLGDSLIESLSKYDFSAADRYRFVHTIGTSHTGEDWRRTGYCGLGRAVQSLGLTATDVELDYIVTSLGAINEDLVTALYNAAKGDDGLKEYEKRTSRGAKKKGMKGNEVGPTQDNFRIYFPSQETVIRSRGGKNSGGTICLQRKWWDAATFPRHMIYDCKNVREGLLMHSKVLFARYLRNGKSCASWAYLGSANFSESAWGRLGKDKTSGQPKMTCRNWECGVIIPVDSSHGLHGLGGFGSNVPVPIVLPAEAYGKTATKTPWFFLES